MYNIIFIITFIIIPIIIIILISNGKLADICITSEIYARNELVPLIIFFERLMKTRYDFIEKEIMTFFIRTKILMNIAWQPQTLVPQGNPSHLAIERTDSSCLPLYLW